MFPPNVIELCQALVRIPSVNPHGDTGVETPGEAECAQFVAGLLQECGAETRLREVQPGRPNVIGRFPTDRPGKPRLIFAPHLDTVSVRGMTIDPFGAEVRDGKLFGRGASDTKGPMAAMLCALHKMRDRLPALRHEVWFAGLMGEEAGQNGARDFVAALRADTAFAPDQIFAVVGEPTGLEIVHRTKGSAWLTAVTRGKAAHAASPELGENAICKMARLIAHISDEIAPGLQRMPDPQLGPTTISVGMIRGGTKTNVVPDRCEIEIDLRTTPRIPLETVLALLQAACPETEIRTDFFAPPLDTNPAHPLIEALGAAGAPLAGAPWFCDAAVFAGVGIPAVAIGPGCIAQAHTVDEWIALADLERGVEFFTRFLERLA